MTLSYQDLSISVLILSDFHNILGLLLQVGNDFPIFWPVMNGNSDFTDGVCRGSDTGVDLGSFPNHWCMLCIKGQLAVANFVVEI